MIDQTKGAWKLAKRIGHNSERAAGFLEQLVDLMRDGELDKAYCRLPEAKAVLRELHRDIVTLGKVADDIDMQLEHSGEHQ